jgi:hypothetical protein
MLEYSRSAGVPRAGRWESGSWMLIVFGPARRKMRRARGAQCSTAPPAVPARA